MEEVVAPIPLKLVRAFSEESHSVNTIRQVFFVIAIYLDGGGWKELKNTDLQIQKITTYRDVRCSLDGEPHVEVPKFTETRPA
jgi:hypothetical protein